MVGKKKSAVIPKTKCITAVAVIVAAALFLWRMSGTELVLSETGVHPLRLVFFLCVLFLVPVCACILVPEIPPVHNCLSAMGGSASSIRRSESGQNPEGSRAAKPLSLFVYAFLFFYALFQMSYYESYVGRTPDEIQHISYIAYLEDKDVLIPDFTEMTYAVLLPETSALDGVWRLDWTNDEVNYLGHPPLYYQIMRLANAIQFESDGEVCVVNIARLRRFSMGIAALALLLIFYIGFTRLDQKKPCLHLLYGMIVTSVPMMLYGASGISNDTLALLTGTVYFGGILRFAEQKRDWKTYLLIAVGGTASLLTKTTAGLMTAMASVVVVAVCLIREKSWKCLFHRSFFVTLPIYLPAVLYFLYIYKQYGTFQPSLANFVSEAYFQESAFYVPEEERAVMTLYQYFLYYKREFFGSWSGIASHIALYKPTRLYSPDRIALLSIWILPAVSAFFFWRKKDSRGIACTGLYAAALLAVAMQFVNAAGGFYSRGYMGGFQSRYYICVIAAFGLSIARLFERGFTDSQASQALPDGTLQKNRQTLLSVLVTVFVLLLFYENFIYFLLNFTEYLT
ncbi:MAG: hypothetical protein LUD16_01740 [Lachnospiraceae bacterium]|nr:hypothetical protein [Lachnospiraceae bacterium]